MDRQEAIQKLTELDGLLDKAIALNEYVDHGAALESADKIKTLKRTVGLPGGTPTVFGNFPVFPIEKGDLDKLKANADQSKKIFMIALAAAVGLSVLYFFVNSLIILAVLGVGAAIVTYKMHKKANDLYIARKKAYDASLETYQTTVTAFRRALANYDAEKQQGLQAMEAFKPTYMAAYEMYHEYLAEYGSNIENATAERLQVIEAIDGYDFVPSEYWGLVPSMLTLLKSGRADDYKEALNLAIREQRDEEEAQARRAEEERRTAIMQQQAEEERRHNAQMEKAEQERLNEQRRANEQAERDRQEAQRAREREARDARRKESDARTNWMHNCRNCANFSGCRNHGNPNCGSFRAR